jgi:hypothetical protein
MSLCEWFPAFQRITVPLSQTALGWLRSVKECQKGTNTFLVLPYIAIGWQLVTSGWRKVGVRAIRPFTVKYGRQSVTLFLEFSSRSRLHFGRPASGSYADAQLCKELNWFGLGILKFSFGSCVSAYQVPV